MISLAALSVLPLAACASNEVRVRVVFQNSWTVGSQTLTPSEQTLVKNTALDVLRTAYGGFRIVFNEEGSSDRTINIEETPYSTYGPGAVVVHGAAGATYPVAVVSSVHIDALYFAELAVARCKALDDCATMTRQQLLTGLGKGVGATASHELGHQAGLHFSADARCDDCYDSHSANTYAHFFGAKHWSDAAIARMRRVLPRDAAQR